MRLSILICSLAERKEQLGNLLEFLSKQVSGPIEQLNEVTSGVGGFRGDDVEVLFETDNGEVTIASKRNNLLCRALGDYICFIDDDDQVPDYYVAEILKVIESNPDAVGFKGRYFSNGKEGNPFIHSIKYEVWSQDSNAYYRCPTPLNPIKREIVLKVGFNPLLKLVEDHDFSMRIRPLLKTEVFIDKTMYLYYFNSKQSRGTIQQKGK